MPEKKEIQEQETAITETVHTNSAIALVSEGIKARMQLAFFMAAKNERSYDDAKLRIVENCKKYYDPDPKKGMLYRKPVSEKVTITGLNIRFVEMALTVWKNIFTDTVILYDDENKRIIKVTCIDLENNTHFSSERTIVKRIERHDIRGREVLSKRITSKGEIIYTVRATDDEIDIATERTSAKMKRNEGLRLIPIEIKEAAIQAIKETAAAAGKNNPDAEKNIILTAFREIGVYPKDIESILGHTLDRVEPHELVKLREIYAAINDGEATWNDYMQSGNGDHGDKKPPKDEKELAASLKEKQSVGDAGAGNESGESPVGMAGNEAGDQAGVSSAAPSPEIIEGERKAMLNKITGAMAKLKGGMTAFNKEFAKKFPSLQNITQLDLDGARVMWEWMQEQNKK